MSRSTRSPPAILWRSYRAATEKDISMLQWFRSLFGKHELEPCVGFGALNEADRCGRCDRGLPFRDGEGCRRCRHCNFSQDATLQTVPIEPLRSGASVAG